MKIEAVFSILSFLLAAVAGAFLAFNLVGSAFLAAWVGSALIALAYGLVARSRRRKSLESLESQGQV